MTDDQALDLARGHVYAFLAAALADPAARHFGVALDARNQAVAIAAAELVSSEAPEQPELAPADAVSPGRLAMLAGHTPAGSWIFFAVQWSDW